MDIDLYGFSADTLAALTGSSPISTKRWKRQKRAPTARQRTLAIALEGNLGAIDPAWHGFTIRDGQIWTPEGMAVTPGDIRAIPYRMALQRELERQLSQSR